MKRLSLSFVGVLSLVSMLSGCGGASSSRASTIAGLTGTATNGSSVYANTCSSCHASNATGGGGTGPDGGLLYPSLVERSKALSETDFIGFTLNGVPGTSMISYSTLTDQQLADVYAYVKSM